MASWRMWCCVLSVAMGFLIWFSASSSASTGRLVDPFGDPAFCEQSEPVEDFGLSTLPPIPEVPPEEGDLPFGPKTVSLQLFSGPVLVPGESVGFRLYSENYRGHTPLSWILRNRISLVDAAGEAGADTARNRTRVRTISAADEIKLFLRPPRRPGFYRHDVEILDFDGRQLASYGQYLRVERKFWDARLGLNGDVFEPGEMVLSRVENFGTEGIPFGEEFRIQRNLGSRWVPVRDPSRDGWLLWLGFAGPGWAGQCSALPLPHDFPPGKYRIVKEVGPYPWPDGKRFYYLTAPFEVVQSS